MNPNNEDLKKIYNLSIYLLKDNVDTFEKALKNVRTKRCVIKDKFNIDGVIYIGDPKSKVATWQGLLQEATDEVIPALEGVSNRAILLAKVNNRVFALPFGYGKHLLKDGVIDRDIAMKTALNIIDPDSLRSLDRANLDNLNIITRTQSSSKAKQENFSVDPIKHLLKGVTGGVATGMGTLGFNITGNDGLYLNPKITFEDIGSIIEIIQKATSGKKYQDNFEWIDNLKQEKDPEIIKLLQAELLIDLQVKNTIRVALSPYMIIPWEKLEGVAYTPKGELQQDFNIESFYRLNKKEIKDSWDQFLTFRIYFKFSDSDEPWSIPFWRCLNYEINLKGSLFVLMDGTWYKINEMYAQHIKEYAMDFEESKQAFVDCDLKMDEDGYNKKMAKSNSKYSLLDKQFIQTDYLRSRIELCDILSNDKELIHVKFYRDSAGLSHLFSQGKISANLLMKDNTFRKNIRVKLKTMKIDPELVPLNSKDLVRSEYTITFAIIDDKKRSFVETLPFFSLLNFRLTAEQLLSWGYNVRVKKINIV